MKKYSECNAREKKAWNNIKFAASDYIFSTMNGCLDTSPEDEDHKNYLSTLKDLEELRVRFIKKLLLQSIEKEVAISEQELSPILRISDSAVKNFSWK